MKKYIFILFCLLLPSVLKAQSFTDIRNSIRTEYLNAATSKSDVESWFSKMRSDGTWSDIVYEDCSRAAWQPYIHLERLVQMARYTECSPKEKVAHLNAIMKGLEYWFNKDFHNANWWYNKIGVPGMMLSLAYMLDEDLPDEMKQNINKILDVISSEDHPARPGGDRIQVISNHAKVMIWRRDTEHAAELFRLIENEARIAPFEEVMYNAEGGRAVRNGWFPSGRGLQADMTFHHRGDRVNSTLTYGMEMPEYFSYWALLLKGTPWAFQEKGIHLVVDYYLDAVMRHLVRGRIVEPSAHNRGLAVRTTNNSFNPKYAKMLLAVCSGYRQNELETCIEAQSEKHPDGIAAKPDAHYFNQSDYFTFARPGFQTAVRMHSERNANQEEPHNSQGIRNHFRGDGACMLSVNGYEYFGIQPVYDFRLIPGTTTPLFPYNDLKRWGSVQIPYSDITFSGAVCDSIYGAAAMDFISERTSLRARKSWFFFDQGYVCLGSGITSSDSDSIATTIEQCVGKGTVRVEGNSFYHAGHRYLVIDGKPQYECKMKTGAWTNCVTNVIYQHDTLSAPVFQLVLNHGARPAEAHYAYAVIPDGGEANWFHIICNRKDIQAVEDTTGKITYITFFEPGTIVTSQGEVSVDISCMIMIHNGHLSVADPSRKHSHARVTYQSKTKEVLLPTYQKSGITIPMEF